MSVKYEYGCIMGVIDDKSSAKILDFGRKLIPDGDLYFEEGQEYGRELEPHITIKFGLTVNYSEKDMGRVFSFIKPFESILESISVFSNPKFDVVKFDVKSDELIKLNKVFNKLPNEDEYKVYRPHLTLAYVLPGVGKKFIRKFGPIKIIINKVKYSNQIGKYYYDLS